MEMDGFFDEDKKRELKVKLQKFGASYCFPSTTSNHTRKNYTVTTAQCFLFQKKKKKEWMAKSLKYFLK